MALHQHVARVRDRFYPQTDGSTLKDTRTLKLNTSAYVRIFRKIEYAYDTFRTQTWIYLETQRVEARKM